MKLLFDQNLSPRLVRALADLFPASEHVEEKGLGTATDRVVWNYAQANNLVIVTKDSDFNELSLLLGYPPKIIWIRRGNCSTKDIELILRTNFTAIQNFEANNSAAILVLY